MRLRVVEVGDGGRVHRGGVVLLRSSRHHGRVVGEVMMVTCRDRGSVRMDGICGVRGASGVSDRHRHRVRGVRVGGGMMVEARRRIR